MILVRPNHRRLEQTLFCNLFQCVLDSAHSAISCYSSPGATAGRAFGNAQCTLSNALRCAPEGSKEGSHHVIGGYRHSEYILDGHCSPILPQEKAFQYAWTCQLETKA